MGMIEEIGTFVAGSTAIGALGTDVFLNVLPESTRVVVAIIEEVGGPPSYALGGAVPIHTNASIEVLVRSTAGQMGGANPTNARQKMQRVWNRLASVQNQSLSGSTYLRIEPQNEPHLVERDAQGRVVFSAEFAVWRRGTTAI